MSGIESFFFSIGLVVAIIGLIWFCSAGIDLMVIGYKAKKKQDAARKLDGAQ